MACASGDHTAGGPILARLISAAHCARLEAIVDHPKPWLRYVDAADVKEGTDFENMLVESPTGEKLGHVEGFIVDSQRSLPYYIVVDAGGWFKSKHFLLPVGHAELNSAPDRDALVADLPRERIDKFPGFDMDEFHNMSPEALKRFNDETCKACSIAVVTYSETDPYAAAWSRPDFKYPDWWSSSPLLPERMGAQAFNEMAELPDRDVDELEELAGPATRDRERIAAHRAGETRQDTREPGEPSPHFGGRAQPGDVLGIETGGESTSIGDTAEDENERRRTAEKYGPRS
jgi:hypothetical protein